ncbi:hypothetical protein FHS45_001359 [Thalassobacillus devorans]|nr:hypothetical protein [Thalassobacillus devorans]
MSKKEQKRTEQQNKKNSNEARRHTGNPKLDGENHPAT